MRFLVGKQPLSAYKACGCRHDQNHSEKNQCESVITAKRPRQAFELQSTASIQGAGSCHCDNKQIELLDYEPERKHGEAGAHPSEKGSLVGSMVAVAADHEIAPDESRQLLKLAGFAAKKS